MAQRYKSITVKMPKHDADVSIVFPGGKTVTIQARPSNGEPERGYNGSLDIILPDNQHVTNWYGDDMTPAKGVKGQPETRNAKQLVTDLPGDYD